MKTFILEWRPLISSYKMEIFEEDLHYMEDGEFNWSVWDHEKAHAGDNFYMIRCGEGRTGVVMKGFFTSEPYEADDWAGKNRQVHYMDLRPTIMVNPEKAPVITCEELEKAMPDFEWNGGHSGRELPSQYVETLDRMWDEYLERVGDIFDGDRADRNYRLEESLDEAVQIIADAFCGQTDLDGNPVVLHSLAVGMAGKNVKERICGFLHDIIEDTEWNAGELRERGFSEQTIDTVLLLTHTDRSPYMDYIKRICESGDETALAVKINDLHHNLMRGKAGGHMELVAKHTEALAYIEEFIRSKQK